MNGKVNVKINFTAEINSYDDISRHIKHIASGVSQGVGNGYVIGDDGNVLGEWKVEKI